MTENTFKITFEILKSDRARVYLNDRAVGLLRIHDVKIAKSNDYRPRLTYRDRSSPFKNLIPTSEYTDFSVATVEQLLTEPHVYRHVCAAILRSYLYNYETVQIPLHIAA